jgi:hypothetical protein
MRKISLVLLSMGALLALSFIWQGPASAQDPKLVPPEGFGKRIAGISLSNWSLDEVNGEPLPPEYWIWGASTCTFTSDGTATITNSGDFNGLAAVGFPGYYTVSHGAWERTGPRAMTLKRLVMGFSAGPEPAEGTLLLIARTTVTLEFNADLTEYEGRWLGEYFDPEQMCGPGLQGPVTPDTQEDPTYGTAGGGFWGTMLEVNP